MRTFSEPPAGGLSLRTFGHIDVSCSTSTLRRATEARVRTIVLLLLSAILFSCGQEPTALAVGPELADTPEFDPVGHIEGCIGDSQMFSGEPELVGSPGRVMMTLPTDNGRQVMVVLNKSTHDMLACEGPVSGGWDFDRTADNVFIREDDNGLVEFRAEWIDMDGKVTDHVDGFVQF